MPAAAISTASLAAKQEAASAFPVAGGKSADVTSLVSALDGSQSLAKPLSAPRKRALFTLAPSSPSNASVSTDSLLCVGESIETPQHKTRKVGLRTSTSSSCLRAPTGFSPNPLILGPASQQPTDNQAPSSPVKEASLACQVCGVVYSTAKTLTSHVLAVHGGDSHRLGINSDCDLSSLASDLGRRLPGSEDRRSPDSRVRSGSPSTQSDESGDDEAMQVVRSVAAAAGQAIAARSSSKSLTGAVSQAGKARKGSGKSRPPAKRQQPSVSNASGGAVRTRPTNNQLLYKAHFRWEHYPYAVSGSRQLPVETEACASVTSAFLQVLSSLHKAESNRKDSPRNILQILSTNTRRTKVVELSSGTHRVPDELRKHCLDDASGREYSTNLDRNRYGSDNQYLNTVIRYDLDFLGLCPSLVDVEIIDAKDEDKTILIQADSELCNCGCTKTGDKVQRRTPPPAKPEQSQGSGMFDMLLLAATGEALEKDADGQGDNEGDSMSEHGEDNADDQPKEASDAEEDPPMKREASPLGRKSPVSQTSAISDLSGGMLQAALSAAESNIHQLQKKQEQKAKEHADEIKSLKDLLLRSESTIKQLQSDTESLKDGRAPSEESAEGSGTCDVSEAMKNHCAELEAKLAAVTHERDVHATSHSYYAVWVQQLQAEVTNLLNAHAQSGGGLGSMISAQLLSLTQAANPNAAPEPSATSVSNATAVAQALLNSTQTPSAVVSESDSESEAALRAKYEVQLKELLHQHFQTMQTPQAQASQVPPFVHEQLAGLATPLPSQPTNPLSLPLATKAGTSHLLPLGIAPLNQIVKPELFKAAESSVASLAATESASRVASPAPIRSLATGPTLQN